MASTTAAVGRLTPAGRVSRISMPGTRAPHPSGTLTSPDTAAGGTPAAASRAATAPAMPPAALPPPTTITRPRAGSPRAPSGSAARRCTGSAARIAASQIRSASSRGVAPWVMARPAARESAWDRTG